MEQILKNYENTFISGNIKTMKSGSVPRNISLIVHRWLIFIYDFSGDADRKDGQSVGDHF